jgi:hypothetical protein
MDAKIAIQLVKDMQALRGADGDDVKGQDEKVERRNTIRNIDASGKEKHAVGSLDVAFQRRLTNAKAGGKDMKHGAAL